MQRDRKEKKKIEIHCGRIVEHYLSEQTTTTPAALRRMYGEKMNGADEKIIIIIIK